MKQDNTDSEKPISDISTFLTKKEWLVGQTTYGSVIHIFEIKSGRKALCGVSGFIHIVPLTKDHPPTCKRCINKLIDESKSLLPLTNIKRKCEVCKFDDCWNMQVRDDYDFCCIDVPVKYIKQSFRIWACSFCIKKYLEEFNNGGEIVDSLERSLREELIEAYRSLIRLTTDEKWKKQMEKRIDSLEAPLNE